MEENSEEEQYPDLDSYLAHHNTYEASQRICQDYRSHLLTLDDDKYYQEIDRAYYSYGTPAAHDDQLANQASGPCRTTEELMRIFGKVEDKHVEKNFTGTDHWVPEQGRYKAVFSGKLKRTKDYDKGTPMFNNFNVKRSIMSTFKHARSA